MFSRQVADKAGSGRRAFKVSTGRWLGTTMDKDSRIVARALASLESMSEWTFSFARIVLLYGASERVACNSEGVMVL